MGIEEVTELGFGFRSKDIINDIGVDAGMIGKQVNELEAWGVMMYKEEGVHRVD